MHYKITPPVISAHAIERAQILKRVSETSGVKVILLCAPAGYGKTTTLVQLHRQLVAEDVECVWVQLDEADNDVVRFLASARNALAGRWEPVRTQGHREYWETEPAEAILDALSQRGTPSALFFDDMEAVSSPAVLALIASLINRLPPQSVLVVASRNVPDIGLARLRANGQLLELGPDQLRLSSAETSQFMIQHRRLPLSSAQVADLHRQTEGWITALWLASMALEQGADAVQFIASLTGSNKSLSDYFAEVVLAAQPDSIRQFLLDTCILDELTPAACDAIRARTDSATLLARIEITNLFIFASDENRSAYRCHSLFAGFLRRHLHDTQPERLRALYAAASEWFLAQGRPLPAITYALRSGSDEYALALLQEYVDGLLQQGRTRLLARWLDAVPPDALVGHQQLLLAHAWAVAFTRGAHAALPLVDFDVTSANASLSDHPHISTLRALLWFMTDRIDKAHLQALDSQHRLRSGTGFAAAMVAQTLANTHLAMGRFVEALECADRARQAHGGAASPFHVALAGSIEGVIDLLQGRLKCAIVRLRSAADENRDLGAASVRPFGFPFPGALLAEALYEAGEIEDAATLLRNVAPLLLDIALPDQLITAHVLAARIQRKCGEFDGALACLEVLETAGHRLQLPRAVACARLERAWGLIERGDFAAAEQQIERSGGAGLWSEIEERCHIANDVSTMAIAHARLLIRVGQGGKVVSDLKQMLGRAQTQGRYRRVLKLRILLAAALYDDGRHQLAMRELGAALEFAAREGWVQTFVEEGPPVRAMLEKYAEYDTLEVLARAALPMREQLLRMMAIDGGLQTSAATFDEMNLTEKELRVLRLLAGGLSNQLIAERLFVSTSTVRTHLRSIFTKLHASSRTQAVAIGRRLNLID